MVWRSARGVLAFGALLCVLTSSPHASALREGGPSSGAIMLNPVGIFYGPLVVEFDFGLGSTGSLNLRAARWGSVPGAPSGTSAWAAGLGAQLFASGPIYDGVFAYPALDVMWLDVPTNTLVAMPSDTSMPPAMTTETHAKVAAFVPQVLFGYEFDWKFLALRLGIGGFAVVPQDEDGEAALGNDTLGLLLDVSVGVTF